MGVENKQILRESLIITMCSLIFAGIIIYKSVYYPLKVTRASENLIYEGVYVNGLHLGGLSKEEAIKYLNEKLSKETYGKKIKLWNFTEYEEVSFADLGVSFPIEKIVEEALSQGKGDTEIFKKNLERAKLKFYNIRLKVNPICNDNKLNIYVGNLSAEMNLDPVDAKVIFNNKKLEVVSSVKGKKIDEVELKYCISRAVLYDIGELTIPFRIIMPKITEDMLSCSYSDFSSFSTPLLSKNANRTNNIRIAAANVNGSILYPGEIFSANKAIGKRTVEKGYKNAPIFQGGKVVPGLAGGICQLVTTIYNTAHKANLLIVERTRHGQPVNYAPPGMDATIAGDAIDLKFKNTSKYIIYIHTYVDSNNVTVDFYKINMNCKVYNSDVFYNKTNDYLLRRTSIYYADEKI